MSMTIFKLPSILNQTLGGMHLVSRRDETTRYPKGYLVRFLLFSYAEHDIISQCKSYLPLWCEWPRSTLWTTYSFLIYIYRNWTLSFPTKINVCFTILSFYLHTFLDTNLDWYLASSINQVSISLWARDLDVLYNCRHKREPQHNVTFADYLSIYLSVMYYFFSSWWGEGGPDFEAPNNIHHTQPKT